MDYQTDFPENALPPHEEAPKKHWGCLIAVLIVAALIPVLLLLGLRRYAVPVDERKFSADRIAELEKEYNCSLAYATPERYWVPRLAQDTYDCFDFTTDDYSAFMEEDFFGEIVRFTESGDGSYAEYTCRPYPDSPDDRTKRFTLYIYFEWNGECYDARLVSDYVSY